MNHAQDQWQRFLNLLLITTLFSSCLIYLFILVVDPYDSVFFSPGWQRYSVTSANRHYTAVVAKKAGFDSAVIGSSSSMLLDPRDLDVALDGRFVNLAMQAASPYEQRKTLDLFLQYHPQPKNIVLGVDHIWCHPAGTGKFVGFASQEGFPEWLYDESVWNDLPPFNGTVLQHTIYQFEALTGLKMKYVRRADGYQDITRRLYRGRNDAESVHKRIYTIKPMQLGPPDPKQNHAYPSIKELAAILASLPETTHKFLFFMPPHQAHIAKPGSQEEQYWQGCKAALLDSVAKLPLTIILDFNIRSSISCNDANYIDGEHYRPPVAIKLVQRLGQVAQGQNKSPSGIDRVLLDAEGKIGAIEKPPPNCPEGSFNPDT